jgi:hypothetical protein
MNIKTFPQQKLYLGDYDITFTGSGSGPSVMTVAEGDDQKTLNFTGQINDDLEIKRAGAGTYTPTFTFRANRARCLRFMNTWRTNFSSYDSDNMWVRIETGASNYFYHILATPQEVRQICEDHSCDAWICIHHLATTQNITEIFNAFIGFPYHLYFEHSNEVWNSSFPQYSYALTQIGPYAGPGPAQNVQAWHADRVDEIAELAKSILDPNDVTAVWCSQMAVPNFISNSLSYSLRPLSYIDAAGIGAYFGGVWSRAQSAAAILASSYATIATEAEADFDTRVKPLIQTWIGESAGQGWQLLGYEGGAHLDHGDETAQQHLLLAAQASEMGPVYDAFLDYWATEVKDLLNIYRDVGAETFGHLQHEQDAPSPRWQSYLDRF